MTAILKTFAGLNFYTRTCFIDYYHISFKKSHQTLRPRSCRVNQNFDISWILDLGLDRATVYGKASSHFSVMLGQSHSRFLYTYNYSTCIMESFVLLKDMILYRGQLFKISLAKRHC